MIIIGITGSIGMGKSTISKMLKFVNIPIHDSDKIVNLLLENNPLIVEKIKKIWPACITKIENKEKINRTKLAEVIFSNIKEKQKLESFIHPFVNENRNKFFIENIKNKSRLVGIDVPLLYETETDKICDYIFLACASKKNQKKRVLKRSNMNLEKFNKINDSQFSIDEKKRRKPIIISTDYSKIITFALLILNLLLILIKSRRLKK